MLNCIIENIRVNEGLNNLPEDHKGPVGRMLVGPDLNNISTKIKSSNAIKIIGLFETEIRGTEKFALNFACKVLL